MIDSTTAFHGPWIKLALMAGLFSLSACGSADEISFIAGDNRMTFAQTGEGSYARTDAGALGDLSDTLPEGVVPVGNVLSAQGSTPVAPIAPAASGSDGSGGGFGFGNITFRTAKSAERAAAREAANQNSGSANGDTSIAANVDSDRPGLLMRLLGMGGEPASVSTAPSKVGEDGLPVVAFQATSQSKAAVNKYLWNATAQTLAFMPLSVADQQRGLFVTDWYMDNERRPERVRADVQHTSDVLGPGSFHVTVYRQVMENGLWRGAPTSLPAARELEERILRLAQSLKIADS